MSLSLQKNHTAEGAALFRPTIYEDRRRRRSFGFNFISGVPEMPCTTTEIDTTVRTIVSSSDATDIVVPFEIAYIRL